MDNECQWTITSWAEYEEEMMELGRTWHEDLLAFDREETEMECKRELNYMKMFSIEDLPVIITEVPKTLLNPAWNGVLLRSEARRLAMRKKLAKSRS